MDLDLLPAVISFLGAVLPALGFALAWRLRLSAARSQAKIAALTAHAEEPEAPIESKAERARELLQESTSGSMLTRLSDQRARELVGAEMPCLPRKRALGVTIPPPRPRRRSSPSLHDDDPDD